MPTLKEGSLRPMGKCWHDLACLQIAGPWLGQLFWGWRPALLAPMRNPSRQRGALEPSRRLGPQRRAQGRAEEPQMPDFLRLRLGQAHGPDAAFAVGREMARHMSDRSRRAP